LANGDQLVVRARLTAGETRAQFARMFTTAPDGTLRRNPLVSGHAVVVAYLLDWNLRDDSGNIVAIRDLSPDDLGAVIDSLDFASFEEIKTAIEAHEETMARERDAEKKTDGGLVLSPI